MRAPSSCARVICTAVLLLTPIFVAAQEGVSREIVGSVREVDGTTVTIALSSDALPSVGDAVTLSQEIPGVGPTAVRGEWEVIDVGEDFAVAAANGEAAKPQPGQRATIACAAPRTRGQVRIDVGLLDAADAGSGAGVHDMVGQGADVDVRGRGGSTPLMRASTQGHTEVMRMLLVNGADPSLEARGGQMALGVAAAQGHADAISLLLEFGADIEARVVSPQASEHMRGSTPLLLAARFGHAEALRRLLSGGADHSARSLQGDTPLIMAASSDAPEAAAALLEAGADPNAGRPDGVTPLIVAAGGGQEDVITMLASAGADVEHRLPESVPEPFGGMTPLLVAAHAGRADTVVALLAAGADAEATNLAGQTALDLASDAGHAEVVATLRDPAFALAALAVELNGRLLGAAEDGDLAEIGRLIQAGADVNTREPESGATVLMQAASQIDPEVVRVLIDHGADVNARARGDEDGEGAGFTALMVAAMYGHREVVTALLGSGADPSLVTPDGVTAAGVARMQGHEDLAQMLESRGP